MSVGALESVNVEVLFTKAYLMIKAAPDMFFAFGVLVI